MPTPPPEEQFTRARPQSLIRKSVEEEEEERRGHTLLRPLKRPWYDPESTIVSKEEQFARGITGGILGAITKPIADPIGTAIGAGKFAVGGLPYAAGELAKYIRDFKDGPQPETKYELVKGLVGASRGRPGVKVTKPGHMESYEYYPEPGIRRVMSLDARGNVISSTDWDERTISEVLAKGPVQHPRLKGRLGETKEGRVKPRLMAHRTPEGLQYPVKGKPSPHRFSGWIREFQKKMQQTPDQGGFPHPERSIWHLYPWFEEHPVTVEEIQMALGEGVGREDLDIEYSFLPHQWTGLAKGVDSPRPRIRRKKGWSPRGLEGDIDSATLYAALEKELEKVKAFELRKGVSVEETDARIKSIREELNKFSGEIDFSGSLPDRRKLSPDAQLSLSMLEREGEYPFARKESSDNFTEIIRANMEKLSQAHGEGNLAKARDAVLSVTKGRAEHRRNQVLAGLDFIQQPRLLEEFERLVVDLNNIPLLKTSPAVAPSLPTSFATGQPIIGRGRGQYWRHAETQDMPFDWVVPFESEKRPPYKLTEARIKGARETGAGLGEFSFLERPEWARTGGVDLTPSQVAQVRFLANQLDRQGDILGMDLPSADTDYSSPEEFLAQRTFFREDLTGGLMLPATEEEKVRLAVGSYVTAAIGASSWLARQVRDQFDYEGADTWGWIDSLASAVPEDPALRQEGLPALYAGEKLVGLPQYATRGLTDVITSTSIGLGQGLMFSFLKVNAGGVIDTPSLARVLYGADTFIDSNHPFLMPEWITADTEHRFLSWKWLKKGFDHSGEQALGLLMFPINVVDTGGRALSGIYSPGTVGETASGIWEFGEGLVEPVLQAFVRPDWSWEHHGWLATSVMWMMAAKPSGKLMKKAVTPFLEKFTGGVPLEVMVGEVRNLGRGTGAPTSRLLESVEQMYKEIDPLETEIRHSDPIIRADVSGREYIFDKQGPRIYLDEIKTTNDGLAYWENKTTGDLVEVTRFDPNSPFARFKDKRGILEAFDRRRAFVEDKISGLRSRIKDYTDAIRRDYEIIVNPELTLEFSPRTKKGFALVGFGKLEFLRKGKQWTVGKALKALPTLTAMAFRGPVFGGLEAVGRLIQLISSGPGPARNWIRYLTRSPLDTIDISIRLLEHQMGWEVRSTKSKYNTMLSDLPTKLWGGLSDVLHGEAYDVTLDATRLREWVARAERERRAADAKAPGPVSAAEQTRRVEAREAYDSLNERIGAVTVEMELTEGVKAPVYSDAVKRIPALRYNKSTRRWEVDGDIRKIAPKNEINQLEAQATLANDFGKNWVEESIKLTTEAIELEMFAHPDTLRQVYWPQMYEAVKELKRRVREADAATPIPAVKYKKINAIIKDINKKYDMGMGHLPEASLKSHMRRMGVPVEDRGAYFGMIRGDGAFRVEVMHGLARLKRDVEQRRLWRRIIREHPELWTNEATKGFELVPSTTMPGTKVKVWGDLAGKFIQEDMWLRMKMMEEFQMGANNWYTKMLRFWKGMHTHHNVPTLMRNLWTNILLFAPMAGIGLFNHKAWKYYRMALEDFKNYKTSTRFQESQAEGTFLGTWSRVEGGLELSRELADGMFPHVADFGKNFKHVFTFGMRYSKGEGFGKRPPAEGFGKRPYKHHLKRLAWDLPATVYSWVDDFHRHVYYLYEKGENGTLGKEAAGMARKKFIDYENVPGFVQFLRTPHPSIHGTMIYATVGRPFFAFTARASALVHDWLREEPITATMWLNLHDHLTGLGLAERGITEEEVRIMKASLPSHMRNRFLPWMSTLEVEYDENGVKKGIKADWWNAGFLSPWDTFLARSPQTEPMTAVAWALATMGPMAPIPEIIWSISNNKDTFRGTDVWQKRKLSESSWQATVRQLGEIATFARTKMISPSLPGGDLWDSTMAAFAGSPDRYDRIYTQGEIMSKIFAINRVKDISAQEGVWQRIVALQNDLRQDRRDANEETKERWGLKIWNDGLLNGSYGNEYRASPNIEDPQNRGTTTSGIKIIEERDRRLAEKFAWRARQYFLEMSYGVRQPDGSIRREIYLPAAQTTPAVRAGLEAVKLDPKKGRDRPGYEHHQYIMEKFADWSNMNWMVRGNRAPDGEGIATDDALVLLDMFTKEVTPRIGYAKEEINIQQAIKANEKVFKLGARVAEEEFKRKAIEALDPKLDDAIKHKPTKPEEENE